MLKVYCQQNITIIMKRANSYCSSCKEKVSSKYLAYCLRCRTHTNKIDPKNLTMTNKVFRQKSKCSSCIPDKSRFLKRKPNKKRDLNSFNPDLYKTC